MRGWRTPRGSNGASIDRVALSCTLLLKSFQRIATESGNHLSETQLILKLVFYGRCAVHHLERPWREHGRAYPVHRGRVRLEKCCSFGLKNSLFFCLVHHREALRCARKNGNESLLLSLLPCRCLVTAARVDMWTNTMIMRRML